MKERTFCYFGIHEPTFARNAVLVRGLRENGMNIIYCVDTSPGLLKYWRLFLKHRRIQNDYDVMVVGYLSNMVVPLARLITRKRIIFNALSSMYEGAILDRKRPVRFNWNEIRERLLYVMDFLAFHLADTVLVETNEQKKFVAELLHVSPNKLVTMWSSADGAVFYPDASVGKRTDFTVIFRGWFVPGTGVEYVLQAAELLKNEGIRFVIIGRGSLRDFVENTIRMKRLDTVELITEYLPDDVLRQVMLSSHVMLGQFSDHARMDRTIQFKTFEAMALGMPYITRDSKSNREILENGKNCLFVRPADAKDIAEKVKELRDNSELREKLARGARRTYEERLAPKVIVAELLKNLGLNA